MLGLVAATVFGAFGSMMGAQERQQHRLNAMELANRLILIYLDDERRLPTANQALFFNQDKYRFDVREVPVKLTPSRPDVADERVSSSPLSVDRMTAVSVRVWLSEESGGSFSFPENNPGVPMAAVTRLMDPIAMRNPDTTGAIGADPVLQQRMIERSSKVGRSGGGGRPKPQPFTPSSPSSSGGGKKP